MIILIKLNAYHSYYDRRFAHLYIWNFWKNFRWKYSVEKSFLNISIEDIRVEMNEWMH